MSLRTRIALTFLILLTAVLVAALSAVSIANRANAERDVQDEHDNGADDRAVKHAEGAEEEGQDERE